MNQKQLNQTPIWDEASEEKQHTLWIHNKVATATATATARASSKPMAPHEDLMKMVNA